MFSCFSCHQKQSPCSKKSKKPSKKQRCGLGGEIERSSDDLLSRIIDDMDKYSDIDEFESPYNNWEFRETKVDSDDDYRIAERSEHGWTDDHIKKASDSDDNLFRKDINQKIPLQRKTKGLLRQSIMLREMFEKNEAPLHPDIKRKIRKSMSARSEKIKSESSSIYIQIKKDEDSMDDNKNKNGFFLCTREF